MSKEEISLFDEQQFETHNKQFELRTVAEDDNLIKSKDRVQHHGEVFTPKWMVKRMLAEPSIQKKLHDIHATFFEPSAGEGAFLKEILHQKLTYVDKISNKTTWKNNALWTLMSIYGIELLEDNLRKAKRAMMDIFINHFQAFMQKELSRNTDLYKSAHFVINKNIVQGNTLTFKNSENMLIEFSNWAPNGNKVVRSSFSYKSLFNNGDIDDTEASEGQLSLFDSPNENVSNNSKPVVITKVYKGVKVMDKKNFKFDVVIGNPPYQEEVKGSSDKQIFPFFMDEAYEVGEKVELITPAKFLSNAGKTPKKWNKKMLRDPHLKVLYFEQDSSKVFKDTDIKGGVCVTYRDASKDIGPIGIFTSYEELNSILKKVKNKKFRTFSSLIYAPESYKLTQKLHDDFPRIAAHLSKGHKYDVTTNIFDKLGNIFKFNKPNDNYIGLYGRQKNSRILKWIKREYIKGPDNLDSYKILVPKSNGSGAIGEVLTTPLIGEPLIGGTQTFITIGKFESVQEAIAALKYIKTKFARAMLGTLKVTQDNKKRTWKNVPLQDFTSNSDIDWSKSIHDIDQQLYEKYDLNKEEINFIEAKVREMD